MKTSIKAFNIEHRLKYERKFCINLLQNKDASNVELNLVDLGINI